MRDGRDWEVKNPNASLQAERLHADRHDLVMLNSNHYVETRAFQTLPVLLGSWSAFASVLIIEKSVVKPLKLTVSEGRRL